MKTLQYHTIIYCASYLYASEETSVIPLIKMLPQHLRFIQRYWEIAYNRFIVTSSQGIHSPWLTTRRNITGESGRFHASHGPYLYMEVAVSRYIGNESYPTSSEVRNNPSMNTLCCYNLYGDINNLIGSIHQNKISVNSSLQIWELNSPRYTTTWHS